MSSLTRRLPAGASSRWMRSASARSPMRRPKPSRSSTAPAGAKQNGENEKGPSGPFFVSAGRVLSERLAQRGDALIDAVAGGIDHPAEIDKAVDHAAVVTVRRDAALAVHARGIVDRLVLQRIKAGRLDKRGRQVRKACRKQGRRAPVQPIRRVFEIMALEI